jgi:hypothetical protein
MTATADPRTDAPATDVAPGGARTGRTTDAGAGADHAHPDLVRDTAADQWSPTGRGFSQRLVDRIVGSLSQRTSSRRSFLTRTAIVGSALATGPVQFLLKPGTAYGYVCGTCSDGWTAFCCTINGGSNTCPPNSFVAGWWKADNAAYCCGSARYIIDCNATCPTQCTCRCSGDGCDGRRTCCNQFRYGQCHQEIACYGPVVCRVATCTPPWVYDPSCTTASATDNRTRDHGAPCLTTDCSGDAIARKYAALGGATGILGPVREPERASRDGRGRVAKYRNGYILWSAATGAHEIHGPIQLEFDRHGTVRLGYPTADTITNASGTVRFSLFEKGRIYERDGVGTFAVIEPLLATFLRNERFLGLPRAHATGTGVRGGSVQAFDMGHIYVNGGRAAETHGAVDDHHRALGGVAGQLGYPITDLLPLDDGRGKSQWFEGGMLWYSRTTGAHSLWGPTLDRYTANGHAKGPLGYPTGEPTAVGDGRGTATTFERGAVYASAATGPAHMVLGDVLAAYTRLGGPTGRLGYPVSELDPVGTPGGRIQRFEKGRLRFDPATHAVTQV